MDTISNWWYDINGNDKKKFRFYVTSLFTLIGFIIFCVESTKSRRDSKQGAVMGFGDWGATSASHFAKGDMAFPTFTICNSPHWKDDNIDPTQTQCYYKADSASPSVKLRVSDREDVTFEMPDGEERKASNCWDIQPQADMLGPEGSKVIVASNSTSVMRCEFVFDVDVSKIKDPVSESWNDEIFGQFWGGSLDSATAKKVKHPMQPWVPDAPLKNLRYWQVYSAYTHNLVNIDVLAAEKSGTVHGNELEGFMYKPKLSYSAKDPLKDGEAKIVPHLSISYSFDDYFLSMITDIQQEVYPASKMWGVVGGWWFIMSCLAGLVTFLLYAAMNIDQ